MFTYYLDLALRSLKHNKVLTALMVLAIALGIGACMTTLTVLHVLSGDPLPGRSAHIYYPQLDPRDLNDYEAGAEPLKQLSYIDAMNLLHARRADRQAVMVGGAAPIQPDKPGLAPFYAGMRYTFADFFPMFAVPFRYGHPWAWQQDKDAARVAVISAQLNEKLFGDVDSSGKVLRVDGHDLRIVGVLDIWRPAPRFYDLNMGNYADSEEVFLPFNTAMDLKLGIQGNVECWGKIPGNGLDALKRGACAWLQFWVQLNSPAKAAAYRQFLVHYSQEQKSLGRFQRAPNVRLRSLMQWLDYNNVVPADVRLQVWLAFGFLLVCLVNTVGLMLAKFLRRAPEIGVRRALGATRIAIFAQHLMEAVVVGVAGGVGGLLLALAGLWAVRHQPTDFADLTNLDASMLLTTLGIALLASLLAGVLPAWRACQIAPALQLKSN